MRRLPGFPFWVSAGAAVAACAVVAVLAATGTFSGGTSHATRTAAAQRQQQAAAAAAAVAAQRAVFAAERRVVQPRRAQACGGRKVKKLPHERYGAAVGIAEQYLGVPYVWGGASPSGFDTSGLVMYVYQQLGVSLPHYTVGQYCYRKADHVPRSKLKPGDLVFFSAVSNVGIYIGHHKFIHAPHTGAVVSIDSLSGAYASEYSGAIRILG